MKNWLSLFLFCCLLLARPVLAADFYQWITEAGTIVATDDPKHIPEAYQDLATPRSWSEVIQNTDPRATVIAQPVGERVPKVWVLPETEEVNPNWMNECFRPVVVTSDYVQEGDYYHRLWTARDECGDTVSVTPFRPRISLGR